MKDRAKGVPLCRSLILSLLAAVVRGLGGMLGHFLNRLIDALFHELLSQMVCAMTGRMVRSVVSGRLLEHQLACDFCQQKGQKMNGHGALPN